MVAFRATIYCEGVEERKEEEQRVLDRSYSGYEKAPHVEQPRDNSEINFSAISVDTDSHEP